LKGAGLNLFSSAKKELFDFLLNNSSEPSGRLMLADAQSRMKDYSAAEKNYLTALKMDSLLIAARLNLSTMYNLKGENKKALEQLKIAFQIEPDHEQVNYFLALLHVEMEDYPAAQKYFKRAASVTDRPKVFYNYGLLLERMKLDKEAENIYRKGLAVDPSDLDLNYVTALYYYNRNRKKESLNYFYKLTLLLPDNAELRAMYDRIKNEVK
jgi:tetratricopeptide (TPR) repeat protein